MSASAVMMFIAGGFLGQLAAVAGVELVRPWVSHRLEHRQFAKRVISGGAIQCGHCGRWFMGPGL